MDMVLKGDVPKCSKELEGLLNPSNFSNHEEKFGIRNFLSS
jgi:hypothetical protein